MIRFLIIAMLCCSSAYGQMLQANNNDVNHNGAPTFSPAIISAYATGNDNAFYQSPSLAITAPSLIVYAKTPGGFVGGSNNCALLAVASATGLTQSTPTDDKSETWVAGPSVTSTGNAILKLWYVLGTTAGTQKITIATSGSSTNGFSPAGNTAFSAWLMELENCGSSVGGNGTLNTSATGSALTLTLSAAPSSGDMAVGFFLDAALLATNEPINGTLPTITAGTSYTARTNQLSFSKFSEYSTSTTSTSMQFTPSGADAWLGVGLVIKKGSAGAAPSGKYIDTWQEEQFTNGDTADAFKFPFAGNTIAVLFSSGNDQISGTTLPTGGSCTWNVGALSNNASTNSQISYGTSCTASSTATITITLTSSNTNQTTISLVSMSGMTSAIDSSATTSNGACSASSGKITCSGNNSTTSTIAMVGITPSVTNDITLVVGSQGQHSTQSVATDANSHALQFAGAVDTKADDAYNSCDGSTPSSTLSEDNPFAFYLNSSDTTAQTYTFNGTWVTAGGLGNCLAQPTGTSAWTATALAFK